MDFSLSSSLVGNAVLSADKLALDLQFATDKTLTARKGPTPVFTRGSTGRFVGSNGLIQSAAINAPRFDHDPVTGVCKGLLMEESRTNLLSFSEAISNTAWTSFATATAVDNQTTSPSGVVLSASRLTANSGTSTARTRVRVLTITTGGTAYSASAFIKAGPSNFGVVSLAFNKAGTGGIRNCDAHIVFSTGIVTQTGVSNANFTVTSTPYPDGWYRITVSATSNASTIAEDQVVIGVGLSFNGIGGSGTFAGTETVFAWGAQLELGSFPTSYIPTTTGTLTRSADVCSISGGDFTTFYNQSEGTYQSAYSLLSGFSIAGRAITIVQASNSGFNELTRIGTGGSSLIQNLDTTVGGVLTRTSSPNSISLISQNKVAAAYKAGSNAISLNGTIATGSPANITSLANKLDIGNLHTGTSPHCGHIASLRYYKKRLANAKLQTLTV